jgi:error-prone DNA polymerase
VTDYLELHAHSYYSLLDGASSPEDLVGQAVALGMPALALTDHDALYGAVSFSRAANARGIRPIFGAEITLSDGHHLTLLVENHDGWKNLCNLISQGRHHAAKGYAALPLQALANHTQGLIALSGCKQGAVAQSLLKGDTDAAIVAAKMYRELFGKDGFWIEVQRHLLPDDKRLSKQLIQLAHSLELEVVATNNVHYATADRHRLQDVLVCIENNVRLDEAYHLRRMNSEYVLKSGEAISHLFADYPQAVSNTIRLGDRCRYELRYGLQDLPCFPTPEGMDALGYLRKLCSDALPRYYPGTPSRVWERFYHELRVIETCGLANYFLIVADVMGFAREHGIFGQGRGSAANSLVAYLLGISPIDPLAHDLVFERFLSEERRVVPDIDIDFDNARREEVIQYVNGKYGVQAAMACTFSTFRSRAAIRGVGKALGIPLDLLDQVADTVDFHGLESGFAASHALLPGELGSQFRDLCEQIVGFPRHLSIHNGGMVITASPITEYVPTEPAAMPGRVVVQWDKDALEEVGLIKIDLLGLGMLAALADTVKLIKQGRGIEVDLEHLSFDDPAIFQMVTWADTVGIFQVESRAQAQILPRLKPHCFEDLIVSISLIRPGPVQGNMVNPFIQRRLGYQAVTYPHPSLEPALRESLGIILFQEQCLKVARDFAGFTPGQGELLRRALGKKNAVAEITRFRAAFIEGAQARGVSLETAETVFEQLRAFGNYSFAKSHAAAFAVIVYQSAWLRHYFPAEYYASLLRNQPMGFWSPAVLVGDAKRHGVVVLPVSINYSSVECSVEKGAIRLGLDYVEGLGSLKAEQIERARADQPFADLLDFRRRTQLPQRLVENLILVGAMDEWGISRRTLLWNAGLNTVNTGELGLAFSNDVVNLPELSQAEALRGECEMLGLSLNEHPLSLYREWLQERHICSTRDLDRCANGQIIEIAGMVVVKQAPETAKGFRFFTLEDEWGLINIILRPDIYKKYRVMLRQHQFVIFEGKVQKRDGVTNVLAQKVRSLPLITNIGRV